MRKWLSFKSGAPLSRQVLTIFGLGMTAFTLVLMLSIDYSLRTMQINNSTEGGIKQAQFFSAMLDSDIQQSLTNIYSRADNIATLGLENTPAKLTPILNNLQKSMPNFSWIGYADMQGTVQAATQDMLVGKSVASRLWFVEGQKGVTTIDVHDAVLLAQMLKEDHDTGPLRFIDVAAPVKHGNAGIHGVLGAHLSVGWLTERLNFYTQTTNWNHENSPFVMGHDGQYRFGNRKSYDTLENLPNLWRNAEPTGSIHLQDKLHGEVILTYSKHMREQSSNQMGWVTVVVTPVSQSLAGILNTRLLSAGGVFVLALIAWLLMIRMMQWVHHPIRQLISSITEAHTTGGMLPPLDSLPQELNTIRNEINTLLASIEDQRLISDMALQRIKTSFTGVTLNFPGVLFSLEDFRSDSLEFTYLSDSVSEYFDIEGDVPHVAKEFFEHILADNRPEMVEKINSELSKFKPIDFVIETRARKKRNKHIRFKAHPRITETGARAWDGVAIDVTDLIQAQQSAAAADEAKSRFLAIMSHEIRTPLNGILGFAQILQEELTQPETRQDVQKIIDTADTLTRILNDILDFSKIEAGKILIEQRPFNFVELTKSVEDIFSAEASSRGIDFSLQLSGNPGQALQGDPTRLRQAITNLVSNAIKFTSKGKVSLNIDVLPPIDDKCQVHLIVKDTGIGITQEHQKRLFQRFEQADVTTFRRYGGTGLGLAIVKGLIDAMGGNIQVESKLGQGTTFTLELSLPVVQNSAQMQQVAITARVKPLKILVVDDVDTNREIICRGLKRDGHEFIQASNGFEAVDMARTHTFDVILMDLDMPGMNGFDAARNIREQSMNQSTFIVALSGLAYEKDIQAIQVAGMNLHMAKPINLKSLKAVLFEKFSVEHE